MRDDIQPLVTPPREYSELLTRLGGKTPFGEPIYRIVLAQNRMMRVGGEWWDWPEGASIADRGGINYRMLMDMAASGVTREELQEAYAAEQAKCPVSITRELRWTPKYPADMKGWIVEKWHPAHHFGSEEAWYRSTVDGVPDLGPYPTHGDYDELVAGPVEKLPGLAVIESVVRLHYKGLIGRNVDPQQRMLERINAQQEAEAQQRKDTAWMIESKVRELNQMLTSSSLAASRWRQEMAQRAGVTGHVGILQPDSF